jgi:hypothetical protein
LFVPSKAAKPFLKSLTRIKGVQVLCLCMIIASKQVHGHLRLSKGLTCLLESAETCAICRFGHHAPLQALIVPRVPTAPLHCFAALPTLQVGPSPSWAHTPRQLGALFVPPQAAQTPLSALCRLPPFGWLPKTISVTSVAMTWSCRCAVLLEPVSQVLTFC